MNFPQGKIAVLALAGIFLSACNIGIGIGISWHPKFVPEGWVESYDYEQALDAYLKTQFEFAIAEQKVPYVYIYSDRGRQDKNLRRRVINFEEYAMQFEGTRIILLRYERLAAIDNAPEYGGVPIIAPVEMDGSLGNPVLDGTSWDRLLPPEIELMLCSFFSLRYLEGTGSGRDCASTASRTLG